MSKMLKVSVEVYQELDQLRTGRQTFSDTVEELLTGRKKILEAMQLLEGVLKYREWQRQQLEKLQEVRG